MRPTITATILAIAASLAAGHDHPSSKSSKSASACNSCSLDAIGRAQEMTNLAYGMFAPEGVITQAALVAFCADEDRQQTFLEAANDIGGCLIDPICFVEDVFGFFAPGSGIDALPQGDFLAINIPIFCEAEETGVQQPIGGCPDVDLEDLCLPYAPDGRN